ncbi:hypothetical protein PF008_g11582 [Phytophthora fragariae]|uniref:DUF6818 domain-containing protein n=1 Tax=Phytophthora fragariae TaxID=53985 RepID=A0A6G0RRU1_9STRA|nr:hypothetical protein PF008_g11582 [Phytophthora fragariae]
MVKHSGSTNYTAADIDRLLSLIEQALPLGKDEWERLAASFNANRTRGAPERDFESLRRKFKVLYSTQKPTGVQTMPPNIKRAKEIKIVIDEKANVIELDDEADDEERPVEPDFCFDVDPDESFFGDGKDVQLASNTAAGGAATEGSFGTDESVSCVQSLVQPW